MKQVKIVMAATLLCMFAVAGSASASYEEEWLLNGNPITSAVAVKSKFTLVLVDMEVKNKITCEGTDEGTVGPGAADSVTKITATKCTQQEGFCEASRPITMKVINLPWGTELFTTVGEEARDLIENSGSGEPGYVIECTVAGVFKVLDECTGMTNTSMRKVTGGVESVFESIGNEEALNCSLGGSKTGLIEGIDLNENPAGGVIAVGGGNAVDHTPFVLDFKKIEPGQEPQAPIEFENLGPKAWKPGAAKVVDPAVFELVAGTNTCNKAIPVKGKCKVEIKFKPKVPGGYVGLLSFGVDGAAQITGKL